MPRKKISITDNIETLSILDAKGAVLYVGKARNLKARVSNYARPSGHSPRIARMIGETGSMMFLTTRTEVEALLLEQNLIKQLKPRYNVLLRDDKSFPFIMITSDHEWPQITKHRGARNRKGNYYGPFASAGSVNATINSLQKAFLLRSCSDGVFATRKRPCLLYQIKRCAAPCVGRIGAQEYGEIVDQAREEATAERKRQVAAAEAFLRRQSDRNLLLALDMPDRPAGPAQVVADHVHLAGTDRQQTAQHAEGRGLARAVGTEQAEHLAAFHGEADVPDRVKVTEAFLHIVHRNDLAMNRRMNSR